MARVSMSEVKQVIETDIVDVSTFIDSANIFVNSRLSDKSLDEDVMKRIELYISAHFIAISERRSAREKLGEAEVDYEGQTGFDLNFTPFGQTAKLLDSSGTLLALTPTGNKASTGGRGEIEFI